MLSFALYPYVYLLARTAFLEHVAQRASRPARLAGLRRLGSVLARGACRWRGPAIAAGTALALMETLADFGTVVVFRACEMFTTGIFKAWFSLGDRVAAAQLVDAACSRFVVLVLALERASRGARRVPRHRAAQARAAAARCAARRRCARARRLRRAGACSASSLPGALLGAAWPGTRRRALRRALRRAGGQQLHARRH